MFGSRSTTGQEAPDILLRFRDVLKREVPDLNIIYDGTSLTVAAKGRIFVSCLWLYFVTVDIVTTVEVRKRARVKTKSCVYIDT